MSNSSTSAPAPSGTSQITVTHTAPAGSAAAVAIQHNPNAVLADDVSINSTDFLEFMDLTDRDVPSPSDRKLSLFARPGFARRPSSSRVHQVASAKGMFDDISPGITTHSSLPSSNVSVGDEEPGVSKKSAIDIIHGLSGSYPSEANTYEDLQDSVYALLLGMELLADKEVMINPNARTFVEIEVERFVDELRMVSGGAFIERLPGGEALVTTWHGLRNETCTVNDAVKRCQEVAQGLQLLVGETATDEEVALKHTLMTLLRAQRNSDSGGIINKSKPIDPVFDPKIQQFARRRSAWLWLGGASGQSPKASAYSLALFGVALLLGVLFHVGTLANEMLTEGTLAVWLVTAFMPVVTAILVVVVLSQITPLQAAAERHAFGLLMYGALQPIAVAVALHLSVEHAQGRVLVTTTTGSIAGICQFVRVEAPAASYVPLLFVALTGGVATNPPKVYMRLFTCAVSLGGTVLRLALLRSCVTPLTSIGVIAEVLIVAMAYLHPLLMVGFIRDDPVPLMVDDSHAPTSIDGLESSSKNVPSEDDSKQTRSSSSQQQLTTSNKNQSSFTTNPLSAREALFPKPRSQAGSTTELSSQQRARLSLGDSGSEKNNPRAPSPLAAGSETSSFPNAPSIAGSRVHQQHLQSETAKSALLAKMLFDKSGPGSAVLQPTKSMISIAGERLHDKGEFLLTINKEITRVPGNFIDANSMHAIVTSEGVITYWSSALVTATGFSRDEAGGRSIFPFVTESTAQTRLYSMVQKVSTDIPAADIKNTSIVCRGVPGKINIDIKAYPAKNQAGRTVGVLLHCERGTNSGVAQLLDQLADFVGDFEDASHGDHELQLLHSRACNLSMMFQRHLLATNNWTVLSLRHVLGRAVTRHFPVARKQSVHISLDLAATIPEAILCSAESLDLVINDILDMCIARAQKKTTVQMTCTLTGGEEDTGQILIIVQLGHAVTTPWGSLRRVKTLAKRLNGRITFADNRVTISFAMLAPVNEHRRRESRFSSSGGGIGDTASVASDYTTITTNTFATDATGATGTVVASSGAESKLSVLICDTDTIQMLSLRNMLWETGATVTFCPSIHQAENMLEGVVVLLIAIDSEGDLHSLSRIMSNKGVLVVVMAYNLPSQDTLQAMGVRFSLRKPIMNKSLTSVLNKASLIVDEFRKRQARVLEVRSLFSQQKTFPWTRGKLIGRGAYATVYEATSTVTGAKMAVRVVHMDTTMPDQLEERMHSLIEEVKLMSRLEHPNIIHYLYCERGENAINVFMEYCSGGSLRSVLDHNGPYSTDRVASMVKDVLSGLSYLHSNKIVHYDIKCANILLSSTGTCKLSDFGTARDHGMYESVVENKSGSTSSGIKPLGTPKFMAPEIIKGERGSWCSDIWSLGCVVMELLTGKLPFSHVADSALAVMEYVSSLKPDEQPSLPYHVINPNAISFLQMCLNVDPKMRPTCQLLLNHPFLMESEAEVRKASVYFKLPDAHARSDNDSEDDRRVSCFSGWSEAGV